MGLEEYINAIKFRFLQPNTGALACKLSQRVAGLGGRSLDYLIAQLPDDEDAMRERLSRIEHVPRMSTFAIGAIINRAVSSMREDECFVNVGLWHGFSFLAGLLDQGERGCIGIDNFSQFGGPRHEFLERFEELKGPNHHFHDMDYREYFSNLHHGSIGLYFYDGHHSYDNQLEGLRQAEPFFAENCIVLVDDTNWDAPRRATLDFMKESAGSYEVVSDKTTSFGNHPTWWNGLLVVRRAK